MPDQQRWRLAFVTSIFKFLRCAQIPRVLPRPFKTHMVAMEMIASKGIGPLQLCIADESRPRSSWAADCVPRQTPPISVSFQLYLRATHGISHVYPLVNKSILVYSGIRPGSGERQRRTSTEGGFLRKLGTDRTAKRSNQARTARRRNPKSAAPPAKSAHLHSLGHKAYEGLLGILLSGELGPNDVIMERRIAEQLGVSRTPLREAIRRLEG